MQTEEVMMNASAEPICGHVTKLTNISSEVMVPVLLFALPLFFLGLLCSVMVGAPRFVVRCTGSLKLKMVAVLCLELSVLPHIPALQLERRPHFFYLIEK